MVEHLTESQTMPAIPNRLCRRVAVLSALLSVAAGRAAVAQAAAQGTSHVSANWELANKFGTEALRRVTYTTSVQPHWLSKTDSLWYN